MEVILYVCVNLRAPDDSDNSQQMLNGIDLGAIGDATENMSMDFSTALKNAVDIKMKGPAFDEFESLASLYRIKITSNSLHGQCLLLIAIRY